MIHQGKLHMETGPKESPPALMKNVMAGSRLEGLPSWYRFFPYH